MAKECIRSAAGLWERHNADRRLLQSPSRSALTESVQFALGVSIHEGASRLWNNGPMRVLFDIAHPAHVHFYRYMIEKLDRSGGAWRILSRDKDVTNELLDGLGFEHTSVGHAGRGLRGLASELLARDRALLRVARDFKPDIILTRNPAGTHVGKLLGIPSVFDTDNGRSAGIHYWTAAPFASVITTPDCFPADLGPKQVRYPSYKALAFLHPDRFKADPTVRVRLGVGTEERIFLVRLVAMGASHDRGETGMSSTQVRKLVEELLPFGKVYISSESNVTGDLAMLELPTESNDFHNVLATASLCIGDSGSVAQEAALLGVPSVFISSFAGRTAPIEQLEHEYGLIKSIKPTAFESAVDVVREWTALDPSVFSARHAAMLAEKVDLTGWYLDLMDQAFATKSKSATHGI